MTFGTTAVKTTRHTIDSTSGAGRIGKADEVVENAGRKLFTNTDEFAISGSSRSEIFMSTATQFANGGVAVGSLLAQGVMFIPHVILGKGGSHEADASAGTKFMDNGIVGCVAKGATALTSSVAGLGGHIVGGVAGGLASGVTRVGADMSLMQSMAAGASGGGNMAAETTGQVLGTAVGLPLGSARLGITSAEYAVSGAFGVVGGVVGVVAGAVAAVVKG